MTKTTTIRLNPTTREEFKQTCHDNKVSMSKTIQTLIALFLNDHGVQETVLKETRLK